MEGLETTQELDEVRPDGLLRKLGGFSGLSCGYLLEQIAAVSILHHNAEGACALLHERFFV